MTSLAMIANWSRFAESAQALRRELRTNRRAAAGLLAIVLLLGIFGLIVLSDATAAQRRAYALEQARLHRIDLIAEEHDWPARAAESQEQRAALENRLWPAESEGVARADLQEWVTNTARGLGLGQLQVRVDLSRPEGAPQLRKVTAAFTAQPGRGGVVDLLDRIAQAPHRLVVERLIVHGAPNPYLDVVLAAYVRISEARNTGQ